MSRRPRIFNPPTGPTTAELSLARLQDPKLWLGLQEELRLSDRQLQVAIRLVLGDSLTEIAVRLRISKWTVKSHCDRLKRKCGARKRDQLMASILARSGLLLAD